MYQVTRDKKRVPQTLNVTYETYDIARQAIRKWIGKQVRADKLADNSVDYANKTYSIGKYGFGIRQIAS